MQQTNSHHGFAMAEKSLREGHGCSRAAMGCVDEGFICVLNCFEAAEGG